MEESDEIIFLQTEIQKIRYRNDENGWTVALGSQWRSGKPLVVVGCFPTIRVGELYQLEGAWNTHPKFGTQFKVMKSDVYIPTTEKGILNYLRSGRIEGIGEKTALSLVEEFGEKTLEMLDENPNALLKIPGIGKKTLKKIVSNWKADSFERQTFLFLSGLGISDNLAARIISRYKTQTVKRITENPYRLAWDVSGIGFLKADGIAHQMGIPEDSPKRIQAAILYAIQSSEEDGHTYLDSESLSDETFRLLRLTPTPEIESVMGQEIEDLVHLQKLQKIDLKNELADSLSQMAYALTELYEAENTIAYHLLEKTKDPINLDRDRIERWAHEYAHQVGCSLSESQKQAVIQAVESRVFILTGGPGVGKTTTANTIIHVINSLNRSIALAAPTGRAAQRLSEVSGEKAKTIHRLLEWQPLEGKFKYNHDNLLSVDVLLVDEASMLDVRLAAQLFSALTPKTQVILIGDTDQLPSVGAGNVLADLLQSGLIPSQTLHEVFRQAAQSQIVQIAHQINKGSIPEFIHSKDVDCRFIEAHHPEDIAELVRGLVCDRLPEALNIDPIQDIQVLSPMNKGILGVKALNRSLQSHLNPLLADNVDNVDNADSGEKIEDVIITTGDKVIQTVNDYTLNVFNGDVGYVAQTFKDGSLLVSFGERQVRYDNLQAKELQLAYAITIHKSQGSEFPVVIIPLSTQHFVMLKRNLIYTALTRARKLAVFVGSPQALKIAIETPGHQQRMTYLKTCLHLQNSTQNSSQDSPLD